MIKQLSWEQKAAKWLDTSVAAGGLGKKERGGWCGGWIAT